MDIFEQASRLQVRFDTPQGLATTEDLWRLPLTSATGRANLDGIAVALHHEVKDAAETVSFVTPSTSDAAAAELQLKFDIVKHVIAVRIAERDAEKDLADRKAKKQRLLELIAKKEDEALGGQSVEELRALAASL